MLLMQIFSGGNSIQDLAIAVVRIKHAPPLKGPICSCIKEISSHKLPRNSLYDVSLTEILKIINIIDNIEILKTFQRKSMAATWANDRLDREHLRVKHHPHHKIFKEIACY